MLKFILKFVKFALVLTLPFLVLVKGAVYIHTEYELGAVVSILMGMGGAVVILTLYMTLIYERLTENTGGWRAFKNRGVFSLVILIGFCINGIFFFSASNLKNVALAKEMRELHPILRLSLSTIAILDKDMIVTDASRVPEDYRKMGLPTKQSSLHYKQKNGYAYAVDLRTNNRSWVRNGLLRSYFRMMGFRTLRHVGTADHLHVSLYCHDRPQSK